MSRQKKDIRPLNVNVSCELWDRLDVFSSEFGQSKSMAVERALVQYLDKMQPKVDDLFASSEGV